MSDDASSSDLFFIDFTDPARPVNWQTRTSVRRRQWLLRILCLGIITVNLVQFFSEGEPLWLCASLILAALGIFSEFQARQWFFCPACDVFLARSAKQHAAVSAFCGHCERLIFPERILKDQHHAVDLNTIVDHPEPTAKLVGLILIFAVKDKASEIVFEPTEDQYKLQCRVEGQMYDLVPPPMHVHGLLAATVKRFAGMDYGTDNRPQSGKLTLRLKEWSLEGFAEINPQAAGEKIVIRFPQYPAPPSPDFVLQGIPREPVKA